MQRRVLAGLGALAIILAAIAVRGLIDGGGDDPSPTPDGDLVVICDTDFKDQCSALDGVDVRIEKSATTSAAIVAGDLDDVDAWVTSDAWYEVTRGRAAGSAGTAEVLARTATGVAVDPQRESKLEQVCAGEAIWACLVANAGRPWADLDGDSRWGQLKVGLPDADTATGLDVLAAVAAGHFGGRDFASNEFDQLRSQLDVLAEPSGRGDPDPLFTLVRRLGTYSAAAVLEARAEALSPPPPLLPVEPAVDAVAVLVVMPDGSAPDTADLRAAFAEAGWARAEGEPAPLLKPGVLGALHELWKGVTR